MDAERRATMRAEVYAKGEEKIHCDKIETVVVRERGRPRRPTDPSEPESLYRGALITNPDDVLGEIATQVAAEASPQVTDDLPDLRASCPWRHAVPATPLFAPAMLDHLVGSFGRSLFAPIVPRLPDRWPQ